MVSEPSRLLRPALLEDRVVVVSEGPDGDAVAALIAALGAQVERVPLEVADEDVAGAVVEAVLERHGRIDVVVVDAAAPFRKGGDEDESTGEAAERAGSPFGGAGEEGWGGEAEPSAASTQGGSGDALDPFRAALDATWILLRAVALRAWIPDGARGGRALLLTPAPAAGPHAGAARAALENAARTLSIEWARHGVTTAALAPADATEPREVHELVAFLASQAGAYYSGCLFTLGAARPATR